jgi:hypothetical protein
MMLGHNVETTALDNKAHLDISAAIATHLIVF